MTTPRTMLAKIWERHVILRRDDGAELLYIDRHLVHDGGFHAFEDLHRRRLQVRRPAQTFATPDHYVPTVSRHLADAASDHVRRMVGTFERNVEAAVARGRKARVPTLVVSGSGLVKAEAEGLDRVFLVRDRGRGVEGARRPRMPHWRKELPGTALTRISHRAV